MPGNDRMAEEPIRVLVVEDDEDSFVLTGEFLNEAPDAKYEIDWAASPEEATAALNTRKYNICLGTITSGRTTEPS